jgi:hypothetical protein
MSVLGRVPYREQLQRGYFKPQQTGDRHVAYQSASPSAPSGQLGGERTPHLIFAPEGDEGGHGPH